VKWESSLVSNRKLLRALLLNIRLSNHLKSRHHLLLEFIPLNDRIIQLNLRQVNQHSSDLWSFAFTHKLFNMLVNCVSNDLFFLSSVRSIFELFGGEHVSDFNEVVLSIFLVNVLRNRRIWGRDNWSSRRWATWQSRNVLVHKGGLLLLLSTNKHGLVSLHLSKLSLVEILWRRRIWAVSVQILLVLKLLAIELLLISLRILVDISVLVSWLLRELTLLEKLWILSKVLASIKLLILSEVVANWI